MAANKNYRPHRLILYFLLSCLLLPTPAISADNSLGKWYLKVAYASMKPFIHNDLWYVTEEGLHIHPRTENYTPGISLGLVHKINKRLGMEAMLLYGRPTATLGIVDQFSNREPVFKGGYHFFSLLIGPNFRIIGNDYSHIHLGILAGWGGTSEKNILPSIGPEVTWKGGSQFIYGGKAGFTLPLKKKRLLFNLEILVLSLRANISSGQEQPPLSKTFGPLAILLGLAFPL